MRFDRLEDLLVDDNPHMRLLLIDPCAAGVRQVYEAVDGTEALARRARSPSTVFTDPAR
ncbi:hypothetical protein ACRAWD_02005 [Caulobacter segnis]